ncbi:hypothetical protein PoB_004793700 [Plakobranchus ocellatus]|uniref:Centromere protein Q n=1 Tax=Plakobranchus ocellatus TaxID=259542 RepID=A0AAV4BPY8_9GAST|nr:hypothetical protein PoB_004793700 [Plakobranchus ocellatus]
MAVSRNTSEGGRRQRKPKTGPQHRKISEKATSKWQPIPAGLKRASMLMLDDACSQFKNSSTEGDEMLKYIKNSFSQALTALRVPDKKWTSEKDLKTSVDWLRAESDRLESLENSLNNTLQQETRKVKALKAKTQQLQTTVIDDHREDSDIEIHPILTNLSEI